MLSERPEAWRSLTEDFLWRPNFRKADVDTWKKPEPAARRRASVKKLIFEDRSNWRGLQAAMRKAMPEETPERRGCERRKKREQLMRMMPPMNGPRPNNSDTRKLEASAKLRAEEK